MINLKSIGEGRLQFTGGAADTNYYNIAKSLSQLNARNEEITDREGNLYGYWCKISTISSANDTLMMAWVPNTWKVRNAFRKFHFARDHMFRQAGITKKEMGTYGRTLRPYFSQDHQASGDHPLKLLNVDTPAFVSATGGEWTYSTLGSAPTFEDATDVDSIDIPMVDKWVLTVLGGNKIINTSSAGIKTWQSVGMVQAYNSDRMEMVPDATTDTSLLSPNNPLAALRSQNVVSGEIVDIAVDQELEAPPYDVADAGDSIRAVYDIMPIAGTTAGATAAIRNWGLYFFPAGLISLTNAVANSNALEIEVLGKELCKDVA
ncbi:MAG TPA: hypothetical protein EYN67_01520 [Flavobacteriales bacterium]|nr:hypothetical protein [Flavobacteriales bacterium]